MPMNIQQCKTSGMGAADKETHSAAFTKKPPAEFPEAVPGHHSRGIHFYRTLLSDSIQQALRSNHHQGSDALLN